MIPQRIQLAFQERRQQGLEFENAVAAYLQHRGNNVALMGASKALSQFADHIRMSADATSELIRFMPDGVACNAQHQTFFWDAKSSRNGRGKSPALERKAYEMYMHFHQLGATILLFIEWNQAEVYWQYVNKIRFWDSHSIVNEYPERLRLPIVDEWITPRSGHGKVGFGSGTPFRYINLDSMVQCPNFYQLANGMRPQKDFLQTLSL